MWDRRRRGWWPLPDGVILRIVSVQSPSPVEGSHLAAFLADQDVPCPGCGYNLRGLAASRCPECNQELALRVGLAETHSGLWLTGLVGLASGAGFSGLFLVFMVIIISSQAGPTGGLGLFLLATVPSLALEGLLLLLWVRFGARLRRQPAPVRGWLAAGCWVLTLINVIVFSKLIR